MRGVGTGRAYLNVRLTGQLNADVASQEVELYVRKKMEVMPPLVYLIKTSTVHLELNSLQWSNNTEEKVSMQMPDDRYSFKVANPTNAALDSTTSVVTGQTLGYTDLIVEDAKMKYTETHQAPRSAIYIVEPHFVNFLINGHDNVDVMELGREYQVSLELRDKDKNRINPDASFMYKLTSLDAEYFQLMRQTNNGSSYVIRAIKVTKDMTGITIKAEFRGVAVDVPERVASSANVDDSAVEAAPSVEWKYQPSTTITGEQNLKVYAPIAVAPTPIRLPQSSYLTRNTRFTVDITGGSGNFKWSSVNTNVASITPGDGVIEALSIGVSHINVCDEKACDDRFMHNAATQVHVSEPHAMVFLASEREAPVGQELDVPLAVQDAAGFAFHDCHELDIKFAVIEPGIFQVVDSFHVRHDESPEKACRSVRLKALKEGSTKLIAEWKFDGRTLMTETTVVFSYKALNIIVPAKPAPALLTVGSSVNIAFSGGPAPLGSDKPVQELAADRPGVACSRTATGFRVLCKKLGVYTVTLKVGNKKSTQYPYPKTAVATTAVECANPDSITLNVTVNNHEADVQRPECVELRSAKGRGHPLHLLPASRSSEVEVMAFSSDGRPFTNFSTRPITWTAQAVEPSVLSIGSLPRYTHRTDDGFEGFSVQVYTLSGGSFHNLISLDISMKKAKGDKGSGLAKTIQILLIEPPASNPDNLVLFRHRDNKAVVRIEQGSDIFGLNKRNEIPEGGITPVIKGRGIRINPVAVSTTEIVVNDLCTVGLDTSVTTVTVSAITPPQFKMNEGEFQRIEVGRVVKAHICLFTDKGWPFDETENDYIDLKAHSSNEKVVRVTSSLGTAEAPGMNCRGMWFEVHGLHQGEAVIHFSVHDDPMTGENAKKNSRVKSVGVNVHVFPPFHLEPTSAVFVPGVKFQIEHTGGPGGSVSFLSENETVATTSRAEPGLLMTHALGGTKIEGECEGGRQICSDLTEVDVRLFSSIQIYSPTSRFIAGSKVDVYVVGDQGETPFSYAYHPIEFQWTSSLPSLLDVQSRYQVSMEEAVSNNDFSVRLTAVAPGKNVLLSVNVTRFSEKLLVAGSPTSASMEIEIIPRLTILGSKELFLPLYAETKIRTTLDGDKGLSFVVVDGSNGVVSVSAQGKISALNTGSALIIVSHENGDINQTATIMVEVAAVQYLTITPLFGVWPSDYTTDNKKIVTVPIGVEAKLQVNIHHRSGRSFSPLNDTQLLHRTDLRNIIHVSHGDTSEILHIRAEQHGETVLRVSLGSSRKSQTVENFIRVRTRSAIEPASPVLHVGARPCFASFLMGSAGEGDAGMWTSSDTTVVNFDGSSSNSATIKGKGSATIKFTSGDMTTHTDVLSKQVTKVDIDVTRLASSNVKIQNVIVDGTRSIHHIPIQFWTDLGVPFSLLKACGSADTYQQQIFFTCSIIADIEGHDIADVFQAEAVYSPSGDSFCNIRTLAEQAQQKFDTGRLSLRVDVLEKAGGKSYLYKSKPIKEYLPAFYLTHDHLKVTDLGQHNAKELTVYSRNNEGFRLVHFGQTVPPTKPTNVNVPWSQEWSIGPLHVRQYPTKSQTGPALEAASQTFKFYFDSTAAALKEVTLKLESKCALVGQAEVLDRLRVLKIEPCDIVQLVCGEYNHASLVMVEGGWEQDALATNMMDNKSLSIRPLSATGYFKAITAKIALKSTKGGGQLESLRIELKLPSVQPADAEDKNTQVNIAAWGICISLLAVAAVFYSRTPTPSQSPDKSRPKVQAKGPGFRPNGGLNTPRGRAMGRVGSDPSSAFKLLGNRAGKHPPSSPQGILPGLKPRN